MYRTTENVPSIDTDLRVEGIGREQMDEYVSVMSRGFGMPSEQTAALKYVAGRPGWYSYLAYDGDMPVAGTTLFVKDGIGELFGAATLPSHRGRGAQGAMMCRRIQDAADMGCAWVITETGEDLPHNPNPSYRNMLRTGFQLAYHRPTYVRPLSQP